MEHPPSSDGDRRGDRDDDGYAWLTCTEAARELRVPLRELYRAVDRGLLPAYRINGEIRLRRHEVRTFRDRPDGAGEVPA